MKISWRLAILCGFLFMAPGMVRPAAAQTLIAKEQIEDAFLRKTGGDLFGDLNAATSAVKAAALILLPEDAVFQLLREGPKAVIRTNVDLYLDPTDNGTAGAKIIPATVMEFPDFLGDKIRFFSHSYSLGISPFDLDVTSDRNIKFHSDTSPDLMIIQGDEGDVLVKRDLQAGRDLIAGGVVKFATDGAGDKLRLYGTLYRLAVSADTFDFYSDDRFEWHTDEQAGVMQLDGGSGRLSLTGPLKLPVYSSLPSGETGDLIYLDHPADDAQDGAYIRDATDWRRCND
ncbi:MAG: hypothetical protein JXR73_04130 [Candidatus Omnitrophica bacterium]|nr:hypothetical protein [Candidatus Omnitrophota bacterium]